MARRIVVGTSSWADPGFIESWYPHDLPARRRLEWYARYFEAVEVNASFYALPNPHTVERWSAATPQDFIFDVKTHRLLSRHAAGLDSLPPDLRGYAETNPRGRVVLTPELELAVCDRLLEAVAPLADAGKLGCFLLQLSPSFSPARHALEELDGLIERLGSSGIACELRHRGWVAPARRESTYEFFASRSLSFVCVDAPPGDHVPIMPPIDWVTRPGLSYVRVHGRNTQGYLSGKTVAERFGYRYSHDELEEIAARVTDLGAQAEEVHVMFNNNRGDDAPAAASAFRRLLGQGPSDQQDQLALQ